MGRFQYCQPPQNQPKFQFMFHKNVSPRYLYIMTWIFTTPQSSDTVTSCTIFKMLYNFTTTYILLNLFPFMSESWAKNTVANIILPAYIICALFMEVGLNYTNIIGNEPILHDICVNFESESDMKQTDKKRLEKKKRRKFMNRSKLFLQIQFIISTFLL